MIRGLLNSFLIKAVFFALVMLILFGFLSSSALVDILLLFAGLRFASLIAEAIRRSSLSAPVGKVPAGEIFRRQPPAAAGSFRPGNTAPRSYRELMAEASGVLGFVWLWPLVVALYSCDIFSLGASHGWAGVAVAAICIALYSYPHFALKDDGREDWRVLWWALSFGAALALLVVAVGARHPYLNPFNPDRNRIAAERVLSMENTIVAAKHAGWVFRYARQLDAQGATAPAIHYYHAGLKLDPTRRDAYQRLAVLERQINPARAAIVPPHAAGPYWSAAQPIVSPPRQKIDSHLNAVAGCTVMIVPVGEVPDTLLDAVGHVIHHELDLPVCVCPDPVALPPYSRKRGLLTGGQWSVESLFRAFTNQVTVFPAAPIKYVLVTSADMYIEDANYVFSTSGPWGAVLSSARLGWPDNDAERTRVRTAKQALCAVIKSFNVPASPDQQCVTSYANGLEQFDAKGNRPSAETMRLFRQAVDDTNRGWRVYKLRNPSAR